MYSKPKLHQNIVFSDKANVFAFFFNQNGKHDKNFWHYFPNAPYRSNMFTERNSYSRIPKN